VIGSVLTHNVYKLSGTPAGRQRVCLSRVIRFHGLLGLFATGMLTDKWGEAANAVSGVRLNARFYGIWSGATRLRQLCRGPKIQPEKMPPSEARLACPHQHLRCYACAQIALR